MSAIVRSWIRVHCDQCGERRVFVLRPDWVLVCAECSNEKHLEPNGLLAATA